MIVNFDVPKKLNKGDLIRYDGTKFIAFDIKEEIQPLKNEIELLTNKIVLLEQRINLNIREEIKKVISK